MSSFTQCLVLVLGVVACGSSPAAAGNGSVVEGRDAAYAPYLAQAIVLHAGWATADAAARKRIALDTDWSVFGSGMNLVPSNWDHDHPFHAPELVVLADGGIEITEWRNRPRVTPYVSGTHEDIYVRERRIFAADGSVSAAKRLAAYNAGVNKHASFRSGSLR
jgi:hypothetical protein